jgi:predicted nuclease of predicted toxin-antitoxin system
VQLLLDLLDQGLPRSSVHGLAVVGHDAEHVGDIGLHSAEDEAILAEALRQGRTVVTLDADFHARLAISGATGLSVIWIRRKGLRGEDLADLLETVPERCGAQLEQGSLLTVRLTGIGVLRSVFADCLQVEDRGSCPLDRFESLPAPETK